MRDKKAIIFYFTGTGNSLYAAKEISKSFKNVNIVAIPKAMENKEFNYEGYSEVGFVMPLYFAGMPVMVKDFINRLHIPNSTYIFSVITRSFSKGLVFTEISKSLMKKGKSLNYGRYISFPDCYIRWVQADDEESQENILNKAENHLNIIRRELLEQKNNLEKEGRILNVTSLAINKVWKARLSFINKTFKVSSDCIKCEICVRTCPAKNIKLQDNKLEWGRNCQDCMACVQSCPNKAIYFNIRTKEKRRYRNPNISKDELYYWQGKEGKE